MPMAKWFDGHLGNHIEEILMNMDENLFNKRNYLQPNKKSEKW